MSAQLLNQLKVMSGDKIGKNIDTLAAFLKDDNQTQLLLEEISNHKKNNISLEEGGAVYQSLHLLGFTLGIWLDRGDTTIFKNGIKFLCEFMKHPEQATALRAAEALGNCAHLEMSDREAVIENLDHLFDASRKSKYTPLQSFLIAEALSKFGIKTTKLLKVFIDILEQSYNNFNCSEWGKHSRAVQSIEKLIDGGLLQDTHSPQAVGYSALVFKRIDNLLSAATGEYKKLREGQESSCESLHNMSQFVENMKNVKEKIAQFKPAMYDRLIGDIMNQRNITFEEGSFLIDCKQEFLGVNLLSIALMAHNEGVINQLWKERKCAETDRMILAPDKFGLTPQDYAFMAKSSNDTQKQFEEYELSVKKLHWYQDEYYIKPFIQGTTVVFACLSGILTIITAKPSGKEGSLWKNIVTPLIALSSGLSATLFLKGTSVLDELFSFFSVSPDRDYYNLDSISDFVQYKLQHPDITYVSFAHKSDASCEEGYYKMPAWLKSLEIIDEGDRPDRILTHIRLTMCKGYTEEEKQKLEEEKRKLKEEKQKSKEEIAKKDEEIAKKDKENAKKIAQLKEEIAKKDEEIRKIKEENNKLQQQQDDQPKERASSKQDQKEGNNLGVETAQQPPEEEQNLAGELAPNAGDGEL